MVKHKRHSAPQHQHKKRLFTKRYAPPGTPPGLTQLVNSNTALPPVIDIIVYDEESIYEQKGVDIAEIRRAGQPGKVTWINVSGLGNVPLLLELGQALKLHPLALEDLLHVPQRPKVEEYEGFIFAILQMASRQPQLQFEQVSLFLTKHTVLSVQLDPGDPFDPVRERIRAGGSIRSRGADYLVYALIDAVIDNYFPIAEGLGDHLESLEERLLDGTEPNIIHEIHEAKRDLQQLRRITWPVREVIAAMQRSESTLYSPTMRIYLRDLYDHVAQILDVVEVYREFLSDLQELYLSKTSQNLNEIMKVLTLISTIFIPLTFIVGVYGMNFNTKVSPWNMPELNWYWGYPLAWVIMILMAGAMAVFFRFRKWL